MKYRDHNPKSNALGPGISEEKLKSTISNSGYPLQTIVTDYIRVELKVLLEWPYSLQQEWAYIDKDTNEHRAIDICAEIYLYDLVTIRRVRVRPRLTLMIECKQGKLPYVFFLLPNTPDKVRARNFPVFAGLSQDFVSLVEEGSKRSIAVDLLDTLGLNVSAFITQCPAFSMSSQSVSEKAKISSCPEVNLFMR